MKRSKHNLSHYKLVSCDMAELVPVGCFEVLPGDAIQMATSMLLRVSPLVTPVMHPVQVRVHHWFVPNRLLWTSWEDFITGGQDGLNASVPPTITAGGGGFTAGGLLDYLGVKPGVANLSVSALPVRAYQLIYNNFYRDADLTPAAAVALTDGADATTALTLQKVTWEKDRFTAARPWAQKGASVTLPLGTSAPVIGTGYGTGSITLRNNVGGDPLTINSNAGTGAMAYNANAATTGARYLSTNAAESGMKADLSGATAVEVNTVRRAFALQRFEEARAMYGSRYAEYLRYLGVRSSDGRLNRPEYLGGGKNTIAFSEVLQTGGTSAGLSTGVGNLRGHGISAMRSRRFRRFFEEHGIVLSLVSVRPRTIYGDALDRMWSRTTKYDYWQKELENIGQEEVYRREVYAESDAAGGNTVFGYNDRYSSYRGIPSSVTGEFRTSTLNAWHQARLLAAAPTLNTSFVECDATKRIHAVTTNDVLWMMVNNSIVARRMVSRNTSGRIV